MPLRTPSAAPCPFCAYVAGDDDGWAVIEELERTVAFVNLRQYEVGASLVIPKRHAITLLDLSEEEAATWMAHVRRVSAAVVAAFQPDGLNVFQNNGVLAGQSVPHVHMHVVPRYPGGDGPIAFREGDYERAPKDVRDRVAAAIRARL